MRILFLGDVMGRSGRDAVEKHLPTLKAKYEIDVTIVNVENAAHGRGPTIKLCKEFLSMGIDCLTGGDHIWDQREIMAYIHDEPRLIRPLNYPPETPGKGSYLHQLPDGQKILITHALGRAGMNKTPDDPFRATMELLQKNPLGGKALQAVFIDFHAEMTSESTAFGHYLDGRASGIVGSHTHVPTADAHILPEGTAYQTDAGMCGDYRGVIGSKKEEPIRRFTRQIALGHFSPADGEGTVCGTIIETNDRSGLSQKIISIKIGGLLPDHLPDII